MVKQQHFDVIIIGGSYAGLSAALALGRSLRQVLIIDSGKPCNAQTPHSHNFITQDGIAPNEIANIAKEQVLAYQTVQLLDDTAIAAKKEDDIFTVGAKGSSSYTAEKLLFATGVKDILPKIDGFAACWGISVLHCPYCHGYEVNHKNLGIIANGEAAFELSKLIQHWTDKLTLFTNGKSTLTGIQSALITSLNISVVEKEIERLAHTNGQVEAIIFKDGASASINAVFSQVPFEQHCSLPLALGCDTTEHGHIAVDPFQKTSIEGIYAAGDNVSMFRGVSMVTAAGTKAGVAINMELINEQLALEI